MRLQGPVTTSLFSIATMGKIGEKCTFLYIISHTEKSDHNFVPKIKFNQAIMCGSYSKKEKNGSSGYLSQHTCYEVTIPGHIWISTEGALLT